MLHSRMQALRKLTGAPRRLAGSAANMLLAADPEFLIGACRLVTAMFGVVGILLDPTLPAAFSQESQVTLGLYVGLAVLLLLFPIRRPLDHPIHFLIHVIDVSVLGWLALLTSELTSPFFSFLPFILLAMTMRWGLKGAVLGALLMETVLIIVGVPDLQDGESELNIFIIRTAYFMVSAVILGYFGAYRERSRRRLAQLADWPFDAITGDRSAWLGGLLQHAADVLGGPSLLVIWRDQEESMGSIAYWDKGELRLIDTSDAGFWARYEPERSLHANLTGSVSAIADEAAAILDSAGRLVREGDRPINYACAASFSSVRYRGRIFVIDPASQADDCASLTEIIAGRFGSELERLALLHQTADTARSEERVRLARDLHDSILQDLTAVSLKLKTLSGSAPAEMQTQLVGVNALIFDQQQRIREYVEDQRSIGSGADTELSQTLARCVHALEQKWDCLIDVAIEPPDIAVSRRISHEITQIVSEATANAVRHGRATRLRLSLSITEEGELDLDISDNGAGAADDAELGKPMSLAARIAELGGQFSVSRATSGFGLKITLPARLEYR